MLNLALLVLATGPQEQGAALPPTVGDGLLHIEASDIAGLLEAYDRAPLMQMIADGSVRDTVKGILADAGLQVGPAVAKALLGAGLPESMAAMPLERLSGMLELLRSASLTVALSGATDEVAGELASSIEALGRLTQLKAKLAEHLEANEGYPPGELSELDVAQDWLIDPWGRPYGIEVDIDTLAYRVFSLGSDGAEGGVGFATDLDTAKPEEAQIASLVTRVLDVVAHVQFTNDDSSLVAWNQISELLESHFGKRPGGRRELTVRGAPARICEFPDIPDVGGAPWLLGAGPDISMGLGRESLARTIARSQSESGGLAPSEQVRTVGKYLSEPRGVPVVSGWAEFGRMGALMQALATGAESGGNGHFEGFPLSGSGLFRMQLDDERFVSELAYNVAPESPLAKCAGATPVPESLWSFIPADAIGVFASSIDGKAVYDELLRSLGAAPGERPKALEQLEAQHGFSLDRDLIGNLGGGAAAYMLPISGVISIPGVAVVVELRDAEAFQRGMDGVLKLLEEQAGGEFSVRYKPYRDQPMWTFSFGGEGSFSGPIQISPSLTIVKNHLLISLTSTRAKKEIKRLLEESDGSTHRLRSMPNGPPADAGTLIYMDWPAFVDGTYEGARAALTMFAGMVEELPLDPETLPASSTFTRFFQPSVSWTTTPASGVRLSHSESSFGPETLIGIAGGVGALALAFRDMQATKVDAQAEVAKVQNGDPEIAAVIEASMSTLDRVATRMEVYKIENGSYPAGLAELIKPSSKYPRGYLDSAEMPGDGWGRDFVYLPASDRKSYSLWSVGENGMDERGAGDDLRLP